MSECPAIEIHGLCKSFGITPVLEEVSLDVAQGEVLGIIGPNGGGKTVLLKLMLGLLRPDRGSIKLLGEPPEKARGRIGYVPQYARFDTEFPIGVLEVVLSGRLDRKSLFHRYTKRDRQAALEALEKVQLGGFERRQIGRLSGGQLQRVLIARAIAGQPKLLLLDEPTASLDPNIGHSVYELLSELARDMTIVLVSHDIGVISDYITQVACVNRRLLHHPTGHPTRDMVEQTYNCPVHFIPPRPSDAPPHPAHGKG